MFTFRQYRNVVGILTTIFRLSILPAVLAPHARSAYTLRVPATLTVDRNSPDDAQQRQIIVSLDGEPIAELMFGDSVTREIPAGPHTLLVDNTWNRKSIDFTASQNEKIAFLAKSRSSRFAEFLLMFFGAGPLKVFLTRQ